MLRYGAVKTPGELHFYRDQGMSISGDSKADLYDAINLSLVMKFTVVDKSNKGKTEAYMDVELGDETISFRCVN